MTSSPAPEQQNSEPHVQHGSSEFFFGGRTILLVANTAWNLWNFRHALLERLLEQGNRVVCAAPADGFEWHLQGLHPQLTYIPLRHLSRRSILGGHNVSLLFELMRLTRHIQPHLSLFFTIKPNILGILAARAVDVPAVSIIEGRGISATSRHGLRGLSVLLYRVALRFARRVIFINPDDQADFLRYRIVQPRQAVLLPGPGVDVQRFAPRPRQSQDFIFLFPARLLAEKGIREYAQAAEHLKKNGSNARFQILGNTDSGNPTSISKTELEQWVAGGYIEYLGFTDDVRPYLAEASVIVLPSYYREGVPRCLLEGMSMQKPILTTDSVGCRETVEQGKNGLLVATRDPVALAEAMHYLTHLPPDVLAQMGMYSQEKAITQFSDDLVLPRLLAVLQEVLQETASRHA